MLNYDLTDRHNPFVGQEVSYAQVPKAANSYKNVAVYNAQNKTRSYKIKEIKSYDPNGRYIEIHHKGQYVESIKYLSKKQFTKIVETIRSKIWALFFA